MMLTIKTRHVSQVAPNLYYMILTGCTPISPISFQENEFT